MPVEYGGESSSEALREVGEGARQRLIAMFDGAEDAVVTCVEVGWRPMPQDGDPIIGPADAATGLYVAVAHPGVTLAATIGRLVADEVGTGIPASELAQYRLSRFAPE